MRNKKVVILIILGAFAVLSLIYGIFTPSKGRRIASVTPSSEIVKKSADIQSPGKTAGIDRRAKRTKFTTWGRNPFIPKETASASSLNLKGIMWNDKNPRAMVGDAVVGNGDKIGDNIVVEVKKDRVILNDGTKNFELKLEQ